MSDRDRKILIGLVPLVLLAAFWFLLFSPKRKEAATAGTELAAQQQRLDAAKATVAAGNGSKTNFAADYGEIVRLGKAIPAQVDMPSLLLQLDGAARGTGIDFTRITAGPRETPEVAAPAAPAPSAGSDATPASGSSAPPVAAGGESAQSAPGGATEAANNTAATSNQQAAAASGVNPADAQTSTSTGGGLPIGGGAAGTDPTAPAAPAGLETVPLELEFTGDFFHLADFFHQVKRFVHVVNNNVVVNGRLLTIQSVNYTSSAETFPALKAQLTAIVYLTPKAEGVTAGATPQGPATTTPASTPAAPSTTPTAPTATATTP